MGRTTVRLSASIAPISKPQALKLTFVIERILLSARIRGNRSVNKGVKRDCP